MFFRHLWFCALELLPVHGRFPRFLRVRLGYYDCKTALAAWHRAELERLDERFAALERGLRVVVAREKARAEGISPNDSRYPSVIDPEEEARVHADILASYRKTGHERMQGLAEAIQKYPQERVDAVTKACESALRTSSSG